MRHSAIGLMLTLVLGICVAILATEAQPPAKLYRIGYLGPGSGSTLPAALDAFRQQLRYLGYVEGHNVSIEHRWADGQYDRLPALAADLVRREVTVIFTGGSTPATLTAKAATGTIPIVFYISGDPVELGLVASLSRPGGNLTGVTSLTTEVGPKRLELLRELLPTATSIALLINPTSPAISDPQSRDLQMAAGKLGLQLHVLHASTEREIETAFATLVQAQASGLVIGPDVFFNTRGEQLAALALRHAVPVIYQYREFTAAGGLMSYGTNIADMFRLTGVYTGRILKGEKPAELPVQQTTKVELIINLKTARALGITFPIMLLGRADEVIE